MAICFLDKMLSEQPRLQDHRLKARKVHHHNYNFKRVQAHRQPITSHQRIKGTSDQRN